MKYPADGEKLQNLHVIYEIFGHNFDQKRQTCAETEKQKNKYSVLFCFGFSKSFLFCLFCFVTKPNKNNCFSYLFRFLPDHWATKALKGQAKVSNYSATTEKGILGLSTTIERNEIIKPQPEG